MTDLLIKLGLEFGLEMASKVVKDIFADDSEKESLTEAEIIAALNAKKLDLDNLEQEMEDILDGEAS